jgi:hypothetical protein
LASQGGRNSELNPIDPASSKLKGHLRQAAEHNSSLVAHNLQAGLSLVGASVRIRD